MLTGSKTFSKNEEMKILIIWQIIIYNIEFKQLINYNINNKINNSILFKKIFWIKLKK